MLPLNGISGIVRYEVWGLHIVPLKQTHVNDREVMDSHEARNLFYNVG